MDGSTDDSTTLLLNSGGKTVSDASRLLSPETGGDVVFGFGPMSEEEGCRGRRLVLVARGKRVV